MPNSLYVPPPGLTVRPATREEFATAIDWAAAEGWNPGLDDLEAFFAADPRGFWMAWKDGAPVSCISVVRVSADFGFLGFDVFEIFNATKVWINSSVICNAVV